MKKIQVLLLCLLTAIAVQAQTSAKAQTRVAEVRKLYAEAKESMAYNDQDDYPAKSNMEITYNYMAPGAGPIKHYIKYYISSEENDVGEVLGYKTYFVSDSYSRSTKSICLTRKQAPCSLPTPMKKMATEARTKDATITIRMAPWHTKT